MIYIQETFVNETLNSSFGETNVYEAFTDDKGKLFKSLQKEYGRCKGKVYHDSVSHGTKAIGWIFESRNKYTDSPDTYLRNVWVTLFEQPDDVEVTRHYMST